MEKILIAIDQVEIPQKEAVVNDDIAETDFLYGDSETLNVDNVPSITNGTWVNYNQGEKYMTSSACTIVSSVRTVLFIIAAMFGLVPTKEQVDEAVEYAMKNSGYVEGKGWRVYMGVNAARNYWNSKNPDKQVTSATISFNHEDFWKLFKKVPLVSSYKGNLEYNRDYQTDCVLDLKKLETKTSYGHCIAETFDEKVVVHDNYYPKKYNEYEIKYLSDLVKNRVHSANFYYFLPKIDDVDNIKAKKKEELLLKEMKLQQAIENAKFFYSNANGTDAAQWQNMNHEYANKCREKLKIVQEALAKLK